MLESGIDISSFKSARILVAGDVMLDRYWWGSVNRISPEAPVPIVRLDHETLKPGGAANVAANASAMGASVTLVGIVGNDRDGENLEQAINEEGIDSVSLLRSTNRSTTVKTRVIAHSQQVVRLDTESSKVIPAIEEQLLIASVKKNVEHADVLILSDYGKGMLTDRVVREIISVCRERAIPVLADPKGKHFEKYAGATLLTPNRREAAEACKIEESDPDLVLRAGERLLREHDLEGVLITESENGMTIFVRGQKPQHFNASAQEVFDVTGAGDTAIACLAVSLAAGFSIEQAVQLSNTAAGLSVQRVGTAAITLDDLRHELERIERVDADPAPAEQ